MRILMLAPYEICYQPRLVKAADYFISKGDKVFVYNSIIGIAPKSVYDAMISSRNWNLYENDLSKRSTYSYFRWLYSSVFYKINKILYKVTGKHFFFRHELSKSYILFPSSLKKTGFDYIYINLVDSLPFANYLQKNTGAEIIYDCQEYFKGQFAVFKNDEYKWVVEAEKKYAVNAKVILGTTNVMVTKLKEDVGSKPSFFRVRNMPLKTTIRFIDYNESALKLVWHGLNIVPENARGVHILLQAVSICKTPVKLYLQGNINDENKYKLEKMVARLNITHLVTLIPAANPDKIVESLLQYDIGLAGEIHSEENQMLTSSNKLFEYIYAGLAVIMPDLPGLAETVNEYNVGELYGQGDFSQLAYIIDSINSNRDKLKNFKKASREAAEKELFWEHDFQDVWNYIK